jgi:hypothetical protein
MDAVSVVVVDDDRRNRMMILDLTCNMRCSE